MKRSICIFGCLLAILTFGCSKGSKKATEGGNSSLLGKWILVETLADPGDGSGKWTAVDKPNYYYLQLDPNGNVETNCFTGLGGAKTFAIVNDSVMNITFGSGQSNRYFYRIGVDDPTLTITGGCIEACGSKFERGR